MVAFALVGRVTVDIDHDPIANDADGAPVFLRDLWPEDAEVDAIVRRTCTSDLFFPAAGPSPLVKESWAALEAKPGALFDWDDASSYIVEPPFFAGNPVGFATSNRVEAVRVLGIFGDNLNTDHISPGGEIPPDSPAGQYLVSIGVMPAAFNTYVGRRGNHHVMMRGTFGNLRTRNCMAGAREGWWTKIYPECETVTISDAALRYRERNVPDHRYRWAQFWCRKQS